MNSFSIAMALVTGRASAPTVYTSSVDDVARRLNPLEFVHYRLLDLDPLSCPFGFCVLQHTHISLVLLRQTADLSNDYNIRGQFRNAPFDGTRMGDSSPPTPAARVVKLVYMLSLGLGSIWRGGG